MKFEIGDRVLVQREDIGWRLGGSAWIEVVVLNRTVEGNVYFVRTVSPYYLFHRTAWVPSYDIGGKVQNDE